MKTAPPQSLGRVRRAISAPVCVIVVLGAVLSACSSTDTAAKHCSAEARAFQNAVDGYKSRHHKPPPAKNLQEAAGVLEKEQAAPPPGQAAVIITISMQYATPVTPPARHHWAYDAAKGQVVVGPACGS